VYSGVSPVSGVALCEDAVVTAKEKA
jgi:hypothetical protein